MVLRWRIATQGLKFPVHSQPLVSVLMSMYGQPRLTLLALAALRRLTEDVPFEVLLADDDSPDGCGDYFQSIPGLRYTRNIANLGYLTTTNTLAARAQGQYLLLLNNDTQIQPGAMAAMLSVFDQCPDAGLVGAKLINLDGTLQEAGALVDSHGVVTKRGWGDDERLPQYNSLQAVDYCSAAGLMIPRALFQGLGGFDDLFVPSHYEDVDLAFKARSVGKRVYYQPMARIVHFEGATCGYQGLLNNSARNRQRFAMKWRSALTDTAATGRGHRNETD